MISSVLARLARIKELLSCGNKGVPTHRGIGFPGDGRQQLRSKQVQLLQALTGSKTYACRYPELLTCNESYMSIADKVDVAAELERFFKICEGWMNYPDQVQTLEGWVDSHGHAWPNVHPVHQHIVDTYQQLRPSTVCEIGAGSGVVSKYLYAAADPKVKLVCLEGGSKPLQLMKINFSAESRVIAPQMAVEANIVQGLAQSLPFRDNSFELVYTCTVMMHMPFIPAILAMCEIGRISSKWILHVEGYHTDGISSLRTPYNLLVPDYERLYAKLGFRTLQKSFYEYPYSKGYDLIVYLAEKSA